MAYDDSAKPTSEQKRIAAFLDRWKQAEEAVHDNRVKALDDMRFRLGEQWDAVVLAERKAAKKPCLVVNRTNAFVHQVTNDGRQNRPAIKISPVDDKTDPEKAEVVQGLVRNIAYHSRAEVAYDTALEHAATGGFGYFRLLTVYTNPTSFEQEIRVQRIKNPFSVYLDPSAQEPDYSDAEWAFIIEDMSEAEFKAQYPDADLTGVDTWEGIGNNPPEWLNKDAVRVAEHYYKEKTKDTLLSLRTMSGQQLTKLESELAEQGLERRTLEVEGTKATIFVSADEKVVYELVGERETETSVVKWCKFTAYEILEETTLPGSGRWIPLFAVIGDELEVDGKTTSWGLVRDIKDPQKMLNYWRSKETQAIALAPEAPWLVAEGQIKGYEGIWKNANLTSPSVLPYIPVALGGQPVAPPQRIVQEPAVGAISQASALAADDMKAIVGIFDAQLGQRSNETSGRAITARQVQGQLGNYHFVDNLGHAIAQCGRVIVDWFPDVYDTPRILRMLGEDSTAQTVQVNAPTKYKNKPVTFDLKTGEYDVVVTTGPSFQTKRQEAVAAQLELLKILPPQVAMNVADLVTRNMDWPGADAMAERFKKMLPAELQEQEGQPEIPPQVQQQMTVLMQKLEALNAYAKQKEQEADEGARKERVEMAKLDFQRDELDFRNRELELKLDSQEGIALLKAEVEAIKVKIDLNSQQVAEEVGAAAQKM